MKTSEFLVHLTERGVKVWASEGQLKCSAPKGVMTQELREGIASRKEELLSVLQAAERAVQPDDANDELPPIRRVSREGNLPASFPQQRLWFLQTLEPDLVAYNLPLSWLLTGPLDVEAVRAAVNEIFRRYEALRTSFVEVDGSPMQVVMPPGPIEIPLEENEQGLSQEEWWEHLKGRMTTEGERPFDLSQGPLFRPRIYRIDANRHILHAPVHHIIFDGISIATFARELTELYTASTQGREPKLPEVPIQYVDYSVWQHEVMQGATYERLLAYWSERLGGDLPILELPTDRPRPPVQTFRGSQEEYTISKELFEALEAFARREGTTMYMLLLAAYELLLQRYTGGDDIIVGTAINMRNRPEVEEVLGFFVNTLAMRTDLSGDPTFRELMVRVRDTCLGAFEHKEMPFERLVDELQPPRNLSFAPIFQAMFFHELDPESLGSMGDVELGTLHTEEGLDFRIAKNDLSLWISYDKEVFIAWAEYNTDLFDAERISRLLNHYVHILEEVVVDADRPISRIPLLDASEREQVVEGWNATQAPFPDRAIHAQFEDQADRTPDAPALVFPGLEGEEDLTLDYRELDRRANRLAHHLIGVGVEPGALVGLCLDRSAEMIVAQLAIGKTGAAYVPLDPSYPADRLEYMALDAGLAFAVTTSELRDLVPEGVTALCLDSLEEAIATQSSDRPGVEVPASSRMYVIYTSGSTGRPKGVEIEHASVSNFLASMAREPGMSAGERLLAVTTLSFDISVLETMLPLVVGGTVIVAPRVAVSDGALLTGLIERLRPQVMQATPATWRLLLLSGWSGDDSLRVLSGGEALPAELAEELLPLCGELWNLYGPTEATIWSSVKRVLPDEFPVLIGHPIANTRMYVLDEHFEPAPIGVPGELWIAGDGLARGYLAREELTAERFVEDVFVPGTRMYRTGDMARWCSSGELECLGRVDTQVKLRGFRIELGEIESVLNGVDGVRQCVCVVREDVPGDQRLVAYYVADQGTDGEPDLSALREAAQAKLPAYMVPSNHVELERLPHTPNGKVDRKALLALAPVGPGQAVVDHVEPSTERQRAVAAIWKDVLHLERVPANVNFFDLGGHSLLLAQVHARLRTFPEAAGMSMIQLFQYTTVESLAAHLDGLAGGTTATTQAPRGRDLAAGRKALRNRRRPRR